MTPDHAKSYAFIKWIKTLCSSESGFIVVLHCFRFAGAILLGCYSATLDVSGRQVFGHLPISVELILSLYLIWILVHLLALAVRSANWSFDHYLKIWGIPLVIVDICMLSVLYMLQRELRPAAFAMHLIPIIQAVASRRWILVFAIFICGSIVNSVFVLAPNLEGHARLKLVYDQLLLPGFSVSLAFFSIILLRKYVESSLGNELDVTTSRYGTLVSAMPQYMAIKGTDQRFEYVSDGFCQFVKKTRKQIIGKTDVDLFDSSSAVKFQKDDQYVLTGADLDIEEEENRLKGSDQVRYTKVKKVPIRNSIGDIIGVQVTFLDVTRQRDEKHRLLRFFLHDAPKPLIVMRDTSLRRLAEGLRELGQTDLVKQCNRIDKNIEVLLANFDAYGFLGKSGQYKWKWQEEGVDFNVFEVIDIVLMALRPNRDEISFQRQKQRSNEPNTKIRSDKCKLIAIAYLLVDNGIKALDRCKDDRAKEIQIDIWIDDGWLTLRVGDNGCGITTDDQKRVYEDGFSTFGSSGLGLHIVQSFADLSGGDVRLRSDPGKGTEVTIRVKHFQAI